ncbi:hypothetical protein MAR_022508, partial [Mya arenaria]
MYTRFKHIPMRDALVEFIHSDYSPESATMPDMLVCDECSIMSCEFIRCKSRQRWCNKRFSTDDHAEASPLKSWISDVECKLNGSGYEREDSDNDEW